VRVVDKPACSIVYLLIVIIIIIISSFIIEVVMRIFHTHITLIVHYCGNIQT